MPKSLPESLSATLTAVDRDTAVAAFTFVHLARECRSLAMLHTLFAQVVARWGFSAWVGGRVSSHPTAIKNPVHPLFGKPPILWSGRYLDQKYVFDDPIVALVLTRDRAFRWADALKGLALSPRAQLIIGEAADFGCAAGVVVPFRRAGGAIYSVSLSGDRIDPSPHVLTAIELLAQAYAERCLLLLKQTQPPPTHGRPLTKRQVQVLDLIRRGFAGPAAAKALAITPKAVDYHLAAARSRLGVATTAQLVGEAVAAGILE
jgi:DNA-binding CsgD family transcriptional regulator